MIWCQGLSNNDNSVKKQPLLKEHISGSNERQDTINMNSIDSHIYYTLVCVVWCAVFCAVKNDLKIARMSF